MTNVLLPVNSTVAGKMAAVRRALLDRLVSLENETKELKACPAEGEKLVCDQRNLVASVVAMRKLFRRECRRIILNAVAYDYEKVGAEVQQLRAVCDIELELLRQIRGRLQRMDDLGLQVNRNAAVDEAIEDAEFTRDQEIPAWARSVYISPWAYLKSMAMIAWNVFRYPWKTTVIDLATGDVIGRY